MSQPFVSSTSIRQLCSRVFSSSLRPQRASHTTSCGASNASSSAQDDAGHTGRPKLLVFGGRGFVGSNVCKEATAAGLNVFGISRSGTPPLVHEPWVSSVEWVRGNAYEQKTFVRLLEGADAVVSCIGGFGNRTDMLRVNGAANVSVIEAAKAAGVKRFVFISAYIPNIPGIDSVLGGYILGKQAAEDALRTHFPETGVVLRPGVIYGNRVVSANLTLPLQLAFGPLALLINQLGPETAKDLARMPLVGAAFIPPISVEKVARAAVRAATDPSVPPGVIDVWELVEKQ